jgi:[methyl-Co(III) methanol-specific corrinoid protein]:coenzyme M methyltransferase
MEVMANRIALVGSFNCPHTLLRQGPEQVRAEVCRNLDAGVQLIAPGCAIPLETPVENLKEIPRAVCSATSR